MKSPAASQAEAEEAGPLQPEWLKSLADAEEETAKRLSRPAIQDYSIVEAEHQEGDLEAEAEAG